jgi:D-tyrosyl-tRNA(Tyr) deacylase
MRAVVQRVTAASVTIDHVVTASISQGLVIFVGVRNGDTESDALWLAQKIVGLRVFGDDKGRMNLSLKELDASPAGESLPENAGSALPTTLIVSQFTLLASTRKGSRPSFNDAAKPEVAAPLYESFLQHISAALERPVAAGVFGAEMQVTLVNDGPVTIVLDSVTRD